MTCCKRIQDVWVKLQCYEAPTNCLSPSNAQCKHMVVSLLPETLRGNQAFEESVKSLELAYLEHEYDLLDDGINQNVAGARYSSCTK